MSIRALTFPDDYTPRIARILARLGHSLGAPARLAEAVVRLSDHYIKSPEAPTPWDRDWAQVAYACYFFPLNYVRVRGVVAEGERVGFFAGLSTFTDFGSGVGTVPLALRDALAARFDRGLAIERAPTPASMYTDLRADSGLSLEWTRAAPRQGEFAKSTHLTTFSYSLTELAGLPDWARQGEALALIEPGTHQDGRRLLRLRAELLQQGYHAWAPCTHQAACPLLQDSERDWCHDRVALEAPAWFEALSEHLPMRNPTLACSYLLLRRTPPPAALGQLARLTGDLRREKGASRQMVCRGSTREFLSWQHKHGEPPAWPRGALVTLPKAPAVKGREIRLLPGDGGMASI